VVVVCEDLCLLSACTLGLLQLLKPLRWASKAVAVLPQKYMDLLDAPVPFLIGLARLGDNSYSRQGLVVSGRPSMFLTEAALCHPQADTPPVQIVDLNDSALRIHQGDASNGELDSSLALPGLQKLLDSMQEPLAQLKHGRRQGRKCVRHLCRTWLNRGAESIDPLCHCHWSQGQLREPTRGV
jgi:hypothetical protein